MISYTRRYVYLISFIISLISFLGLEILFHVFIKVDFPNTPINPFVSRDLLQVEMITDLVEKDTKENEIYFLSDRVILNRETTPKTEQKQTNWTIKIPVIALEAEIAEGTEKQVMDFFVGHFADTAKKQGNIGLAAHNRGYRVNYFADLKKVKKGDEIEYQFEEFQTQFVVTKNVIISDEDWSYLEDTKDNTITLITCVENEPQYRRCVQASEKEKGD